MSHEHGAASFANGVRQIVARAGLALLGMILSGMAAGQPASWSVHPGLTDRWTFEAGAFFPKIDTTASLNSTGGAIGTSVNFENELGFEDSETVGSFLARVRLGERWRIEFEYFALNRTSSRTISRTIQWGDTTFPFSTEVRGEFDSDIYRLSGGYSFIKNNQGELGAVLGLHVTDFNMSLRSTNLSGQTGEAIAPLPTIGLYGSYAFTPRWLLSGRVDYFSLDYDDYDGSLLNLTAAIDYRFTKNFGIGAGWRHVDYDLTVTKTKLSGNVNYKFSGPVVYLVASF
jgi:hypothetical protein